MRVCKGKRVFRDRRLDIPNRRDFMITHNAAIKRKALEQKAAVDKEKDRKILIELLDKEDRKNG